MYVSRFGALSLASAGVPVFCSAFEVDFHPQLGRSGKGMQIELIESFCNSLGVF